MTSEMSTAPFVLGVAGGSGSGKSTIVDQIMASSLAPHISLIRHDAYYLNGDQMPEPVRVAQNWDHPDALDNSLFVQHVDDLRSGRIASQPVYDFATHSRSNQTEVIEPRPIVLLEGILLLAIPEIRQRIDLAFFVDTPAEERIIRRVLRDVRERSRTVDSVAEQFRSTVRPMHDQLVQPSRVYANIIIPWDWGASNQPAIDVILATIERKLNESP